MSSKQSSDHMQKAGASGTKVTSVTGVVPKVSGQLGPTATNPSGSSQSTSRGKQGRG